MMKRRQFFRNSSLAALGSLFLSQANGQGENSKLLFPGSKGKAKNIIFDMMTELGYVQYSVYKTKLVKDFSNEIESGDYLFIHESKEKIMLERMKKLNLI